MPGQSQAGGDLHLTDFLTREMQHIHSEAAEEHLVLCPEGNCYVTWGKRGVVRKAVKGKPALGCSWSGTTGLGWRGEGALGLSAVIQYVT